MITEITKGVDDSSTLPRIVKRTGYRHFEQDLKIEIYYSIYAKNPNNTLTLIKNDFIVVIDKPEVPASYNNPLGLPLDQVTPVPAIPAVTTYTDTCKQFNADAIGAAIDAFLTTLEL